MHIYCLRVERMVRIYIVYYRNLDKFLWCTAKFTDFNCCLLTNMEIHITNADTERIYLIRFRATDVVYSFVSRRFTVTGKNDILRGNIDLL